MPNGIEDIAGLLPRAPQQAPLKDYGQIQDQISQTRENNARAQALQQATLEAQRVQQDRIKKQQAMSQAMQEAKTLDDLPMLYGKYSGDGQAASTIAEGIAQTKAHLAKADTDQLAAQVQRDDSIENILSKVVDPNNPDKTWFEYQKAAGDLAKYDPNLKFSSPDQIAAYQRRHYLGSTAAKDELKKREIAVTEQNANTNSANADTRLQAQNNALRAKGLKVNDKGEIESLPFEELPLEQQAVITLKKSQSEATDALADLRKAQASGDTVQLQQAAQRLKIAQQNANISAQRLGLSQNQFEARTFGTVGGNAVPGALTTEEGTPVGSSNAANVRPTGTSKSAAERATVMMDIDARIRKQMDDPEVKKMLGPGSGRAAELEGKIGTLTAKQAEFLNDLKSYAAFQAGLHPVRGLGGLQYFDEVMGGLGQTPEQLKGKLNSNLETAKKAQEVGTPRVVKPSIKKRRFNPTTGELEEIK